MHIVSDREFKRIKDKYYANKGNHSDVKYYSPKKAWSVRIATARKAFEKKGRVVGKIMELYHGTSAANLLSIMKQGMVIPPATAGHCTGRCFGHGCYFSDMSSKSLRYATGGWGQRATNRTFMFLANVAMGKSYSPRDYQYGSFRLPSGYDSCFAKGGTGNLVNNEMIVYKTYQCDLTFLIEFAS